MSPIEKLSGGLVQINNKNDFVGFGFLINAHQIITCEHPLKKVKQLDPQGYKITFPLSDSKTCYARVMENGLFPEYFVDIAILEINNAQNFHFQPSPIVFIQPEALWHHSFIAFGFPVGTEIMAYVDGIIQGPNNKQWIQLEDNDKTGRFIGRGFSGTPIWDDQLQAIVGMLVAYDEKFPTIAYMTPITTIAKTYPKIIADVYDNIKSFWRVSLENRYGFRKSYVEPPLKIAWKKFSQSRSWRAIMSDKMKRIRDIVKEFDSLHEVARAVAQTQKKIEINATYEDILKEIIELVAILDTSRITKKINQQITDLENIIGVHATDLRNSRKRRLSLDEKHLLKLSSLKQYQIELRAVCQTPDFNKCLLIMGSMGSGKTHFIHDILADSLEADNLVILPVSKFSKMVTVVDILLESLNIASGIQWPGLEYFNSFLQAYDNYMDHVYQEQNNRHISTYDFTEEDNNFLEDAVGDDVDPSLEYIEEETLIRQELGKNLRFEEMHHETRWIIAMDNLSSWVVDKESFIIEWIDLVTKSTILHNLYWLVTIPTSYYAQLAQNSILYNNFWIKYGLLPDQDDTTSYIHGYSKHLPNITRWLALDVLNEQDELGLNLVRECLTEKWEPVNLAIEHNETAKKNLNNPLIAWIWLDMISQEEFSNLVTAVNLNYIEFIRFFWNQQFSSLLLHPINQRYVSPFSEKELLYFVILLARILTHHPGHSIDVSKLISSICILSNGKMGFNDRNRVEMALNLIKVGLILGEEIEENSLLEPEENLELRFYPFWGFFLAQEIVEQCKNIPTSPLQIEQRFINIQDEMIPDTLEYFLLLANNQYSGTNSLPFFENSLASSKLPGSSVWMASAKSNGIIISAMTERAQRFVGRVFDPQTLFAYLYFVYEIPIQMMSVRDRFSVFHKLFLQIGRNNLSGYFIYIAEQLFMKLESTRELLSVMPSLSNSEVMGISRNLAELTTNTLFRLERKRAEQELEHVDGYDPNKILNRLIEYLISVKNEYYHENDWDSYRECVLFFVLNNLAYNLGPELYAHLIKVHWYENSHFNYNQQIQLHMERQANLALGMLYRERDKRKLIDLLTELCESDDALEHTNAVHIIRHTEVIGDKIHNVLVSEEFIPLLGKLFLDTSSRMTNLINHPLFNKFFRDNLSNFDDLQNKRNNLIPK